MIADRAAAPVLPECDALTLFRSMPEDGDWCEDCDLLTALVYVRGSKKLRIPELWRGAWPGIL